MTLLEKLEWALYTIEAQLQFGLPEDQAIMARERRVKGVLMGACEEVATLTAEIERLKRIMQSEALLNTSLHRENEKLKRIVEVLEKSNEFYAKAGSWKNSNGAQYHEDFLLIRGDGESFGRETVGGKTARQAKAEVERIRGEGK